ncbi:ABC transporter ATP-binding protein [Streptomyces sp. GLT-R25]
MPTTPAPAADTPAEEATETEPARSRSAVRSLLRLWPYVRPVRVRLFTAAVVAVLASCTGLVIPLVLKWIVDGPVADRDTGGVWLGALYLLLLGLAEAVLFGLRRWLVARPLAGVEASMRADLYRHLQRLPVAFHDRWPSGQLLSRGTTDLMLLRMFLAFPLTFLLVNGVTILIGFVIMLAQEWTLGLVLLAPAVPVMIVCWLFEKQYSKVARRAQDQVGDLTTLVEESVLGIRIIKGFGRHRSQALAFRELSRTLRGTELAKARLLAWIFAAITILPELAIGAALVLGTVQVADGELSTGTLVAFLSTALALRWPIESIGFLLAMSQEAATATERYFEVMDAEPESVGHQFSHGLQHRLSHRLRHGLRRRPRHRRTPFPRRPVPLPRRPGRLRSRTRPHRPPHPLRRDHGPRRRDRYREDDAHRAGPPAARGHGGPDHPGRRGHHRDAPGNAARTRGGRLRGADPLLGERRGERPHGRRGPRR